MSEEEKQQKTIQHLQFMLDEKILPEIQELKENMDGLRAEFKEGFNHLASQITGTYSEYNLKYVKKDMFEEIMRGLTMRIGNVEGNKVYADHENRLRILEQWGWKIVGAIAIIQPLVAYLITKYAT